MNVIAVDVGTTSVRLAIIAFHGVKHNEVQVLASHERNISYKQEGAKFEQDSEEIWTMICECTKYCLNISRVEPPSIRGIAFSATCSLAIIEHQKRPGSHDIIMWMDHRAIDEAQSVTDDRKEVLGQFGGVCSPEFSLSKLLWLKNNDPVRLNHAAGIFELPDWLVYRCVGGDVKACPQSLCCVTCKWGYDVERNQHCDYIRSLGSCVVQEKMGQKVLAPGTISGVLCAKAALELGLINASSPDEGSTLACIDIIVGTSLIDAHSGMLAMLSLPLDDLKLRAESTFCSLAGTSTCNMVLSKKKNFTRGIWGPYKNVVIDNYYLLEAGQSMTGKLIDMCIESHHQGKGLLKEGHSIRDITKKLNEEILRDNSIKPESYLHVLPTFHGNRSPLANPRLKGGIYGLTSERQASLREHYIATVESIIYETHSIIETLGTNLDAILVSGGLRRNAFYMQTLADALNCKVIGIALDEVDFMVMGSALIARQAVLNASCYDGRSDPGKPLDEGSLRGFKYNQLKVTRFEPRRDRSPYHSRKYLCYKSFVKFSLDVDEILSKK